jgi:NAD(P)H-quinone oxidoreductase subunit 5
MPDSSAVIGYLSLLVVLFPTLLVGAMGVPALIGYKLSEERIAFLVKCFVGGAFLSACGLTLLMLATDRNHVSIDFGNWVVLHSHRSMPGDSGEYHFAIKLIFDRLSIPFVILSLVLCGTISAFAVKYMHRETGYNRFFTLYSIFVLGMVLTATAGTIETLFAGWEMVGLSSALLVAFFQERANPARNGLHIWVIYRISDAALLLAAVVLHHMAGKGDFGQLLGTAAWPDGTSSVTEAQGLIVGLLLIVAAAGKSALIPFSGWLPRAMEGPTPSSAVFYGALSVHLGAYLLLRVSPLLDASPTLSTVVVILGLSTAVMAYLVGSVQTDIKSALSYASLAQVGIIVAEIGFGLRFLALIHLIGHASLRTLQFIRAPSLLRDYRSLENAIGSRLPQSVGGLPRFTPPRFQRWLYRFALERGYLDAILMEYCVRPFVACFRRLNRIERQATDTINGVRPVEPAGTRPPLVDAADPQHVHT